MGDYGGRKACSGAHMELGFVESFVKVGKDRLL